MDAISEQITEGKEESPRDGYKASSEDQQLPNM